MGAQPSNEVNISLAEVEPPGWLARCERFCRSLLDRLEIHGWELSILFCNDRFIRELNRKYRGKDQATDVLSFAQEGEGFPSWETRDYHLAGDIVISLEALERNAAEARVPPGEELKRLLIHGILHLKGMEHPGEDAPDHRGQPARPSAGTPFRADSGGMLELQETLIRIYAEEKVF